jgi:hypothetical protein
MLLGFIDSYSGLKKLVVAGSRLTNGVLSGEAPAGQSNLNTGHEVINALREEKKWARAGGSVHIHARVVVSAFRSCSDQLRLL